MQSRYPGGRGRKIGEIYCDIARKSAAPGSTLPHQAQAMIELTCVYLHELHRFQNTTSDVIIATARPQDSECEIKIKGPAEIGDLTPRLCYRFYGQWSNYHNKRTGQTEQQFHFRTLVETIPFSAQSVKRYLQQCNGIGPTVATRLWNYFEEKSVVKLRESPDECASAVEGLSLKVARSASIELQQKFHMEGCMIEMLEILDGRGFPKETGKRAIREWGNEAPRLIRKNPFLLMQFRGCGFKLCDALYLDLGLRPDALKRQALCAWYFVASYNGDTWIYREAVDQAIRGEIGSSNPRYDDAVRLAVRGGLLSAKWTDTAEGPPVWDGRLMWLAERRSAEHEKTIAEFVKRRMVRF